MNRIKEFNQKLIDDNAEINIMEYIRQLNNMFYNIDIGFMGYFMDLVDRDDFCISHQCLYDYGVLTNTKSTNDIKRILDQYSFIEGIDYQLFNILTSNNKYKNEYHMKPGVFKMCLMRSKNSQKYAKYYILLEECIKHYNDFQLKMKISEINRLIKKLDVSNYELQATRSELKDIKIELQESNEKLEDINEKLEETIPIDDEVKQERLIILKLNDDRYKTIRGQNAYINNQLKKKTNREGIIILEMICSPNASALFNHIKYNMNDKIKYYYTSFTLLHITEKELISELMKLK